MRGRAVVLFVAAAVVFAGCSGGRDNSESLATEHRTVVVNDEPTDLCVAIAGTTAQQVNGLGNRPGIPSKEGMAFPFAVAAGRSFTMKDTSFPLAIVWVGQDAQVLGSANMTPKTTVDYDSPGPITMAVELSPQDWAPLAGTAKTLELGQACPGTIVAGRPGQPPTQF